MDITTKATRNADGKYTLEITGDVQFIESGLTQEQLLEILRNLQDEDR